ncbi:flagellar biosynthesis protein FlhB [Alteromonas sediminis]|uniref:Flagellar biosynthesis protein FlhB n=1 Tax=Alteromonas sediminis TaxID=2259342 RepID=A0A3N5Y343_9ALTE|nr:EscU/YscU/HrcU family type III secretion system export apparatus switch protein [Alteromonas sediminis]RPJ68272.1 flagellar biosynthesis protein FlhB [Alteromonas sediminis]
MIEKTKRAIGLKYSPGSGEDYDKKVAPKVIAKGEGKLAESILELAQASGVLVHEDPYLMEFLSLLDLGQDIPEELYMVIAELIAYSHYLQGKHDTGWEA